MSLNSIGHTAMDCATIKSQQKVRLQNSSKANAGNVMFVGKQSKVAGKLTKALDVNNCDVQFVYVIQVLMFQFYLKLLVIR